MKDLLELAGRVEALTGPDRAVDAEIWHATAALPDGYRWLTVNGEWCQAGPYGVSDLDICEQRYTASLADAVSLVPDRHDWASGNEGSEGGPWACVTQISGGCRDFAVHAATPALALTAAALRARGTQQ